MSRTQLGPLAAVVIVVLRLAIGLHFMSEGLDKVRGTKPFSSAGFLGNAKGPRSIDAALALLKKAGY